MGNLGILLFLSSLFFMFKSVNEHRKSDISLEFFKKLTLYNCMSVFLILLSVFFINSTIVMYVLMLSVILFVEIISSTCDKAIISGHIEQVKEIVFINSSLIVLCFLTLCCTFIILLYGLY